ncbi:MAG: heavy metal translocating P-type ATPase [Desulfobacterales bacterium]|jgi:Cd2+/Zn2+-exporting ATPase|nr:heavy metal translocating P-type ATPase [Desulfobacterales bacterium]
MATVYHITGLDCASCGLKLETAIKKLPGVSYAVLDFANLRLHLEALDVERVRAEIKRIEPTVEILSAAPHAEKAQSQADVFGTRRAAGIIIAALILLGVHAVFEERFHASGWLVLDYGIALIAYFLAGTNIYVNAFRTFRRGDFFDENVLMVVATGGAIAIHSLSEAVAVMIFFKTGELLQNLAVARSRRSIHALLASKPDHANLETDEGLRQVPPEQVRVGEIILVKPGEKVPLDGEVVMGQSSLDASALTGESVPLSARIGDSLMAGMINLAGALKLRVTKPFNESSIAKILDLVENASARKAATEKFITRFARWYTPIVVGAAAGIAVLPPLIMAEANFKTWIYRALVVLVISCPCALVISIPLGYFGGVGRASRQGILVKGSNFLDALAAVKTVVFDKTGTLTRGDFAVQTIVPVNGFEKQQLMEFAALAEMHSNHPIAKSIIAKGAEMGLKLDGASIVEHVELPGRGVRALVGGHEILVGSDGWMHHQQIVHHGCALESTAAHVVIDGEYAGYIVIGDSIKADARQAIAQLRSIGIERIEMLTGDNRCTAESVARALGVDAFHAELLPEDKVRLLEEIQSTANHGGKVAFVGDGINDAPVLARADVGVAMGALGTDAAIETADVVLMTDSPLKMAEAVQIARQTRIIIWQNIVMALSIKVVFVALGVIGLASMWEAVFADMGVALAAIINSTRMLRTSGRAEPTVS